MNKNTELDYCAIREKDGAGNILMLAAFALLVTLIISLGYAEYRDYKKIFTKKVREELASIADLKSFEISQYIKERLADGDRLFKRRTFYNAVKGFFENPGDKENRSYLEKWIARYGSNYQYDNAFIIDLKGNMRMGAPKKETVVAPEILNRLPEVLRKGQVTLADFYRNTDDGHAYLSILVPILDEDIKNPPLGVLVLQIDPTVYLYPFIEMWPGSSETAETLLVRKDGGDVLFLNQLRFQKNTALNLRFAIDLNKDLPAAKAVSGQQGLFEGRDYRGVLVTAYVRPIDNTPWFLVARIDRSEIFAPLRYHLRNLTWLIVSMIFSISAIILFIIKRKDLLFYRARYRDAEALRASEERYRRLFESAKDGILIVDFDTGSILDVNHYLVELLGYSRSDLLKKHLWDIGSVNNIPSSKERFLELKRKGSAAYDDLPIIAKDGKVIESEFVNNVYDVKGAKAIQCNIRDITERKRLEEQKKIAEKYISYLTKYANDFIILLDKDFNFLEVNERVVDFYGYTREELLKMHATQFRTLEARESFKEQIKSAQATGKALYETTHQRKDGTQFPVEISIRAIRVDDKLLYQAIIRDITERKKLENELAQAKEAQYRTLIENLPQSVFLKDRDLVYRSCNTNFAKDLDIEPSMIAGKTDYDFFPSHLAEKYRSDDKRIMASGNTESIEEEFITIDAFLKKSEKKIASTIKIPIRDHKGNVTGILGLYWDITERKKSEDKIRNLNKQIEFILGATKTGLDIIDPDFNVVYINPDWQKIYGDPKGKKCYEYFMGRDTMCPGCGVAQALKTKKTVVTEEVLAKEGNRPIQVVTIPFQDADGNWLVAEVNSDISERKKSEEALKKSEKYFRSLIENSMDITLITDKKGAFTYASPSVERIAGYKPEELIGKSCFDFIVPADRPKAIYDFGKALLIKNALIPNAFHVRHKNGSIRFLEGLGNNLFDDPMIAGFIMNVHDVTERKQAENALRESEYRYRSLFTSSRDAVMTLEPPSWKFTSGNPATIEMFRAKNEEEFLSYEPWMLSPEVQPDGRTSTEKAKAMIEKAMREGSNFFAWTHKRMNGEEFPAEILLSRIEQGGKVYLHAAVRDITERKRAELELKESEQKFRTIFEKAKDGILLADPKMKKFHMCNDTICKMLGYSPEEIKNLSVSDIHPGKDIPHVLDQFEKLAKGEISSSKNLPVKRKDGSIFYADVSVARFTLQGDTYIAGFFHDLTPEKIAEEERARAEKMRVAADMKSKLVATVSHEFRSPLAAIKEGVSLVLDGLLGDINSEQKDILATTRRNIERLNRLIENVLMMGKIESGKMDIHLEEADINDLVTDTCKAMYVLANEKGLELTANIDEDMPKIMIDTDKIIQVITNLLSNAIKFTEKGSITLTTKLEDAAVHVTIQDTGPGINPENAARLFGVFETFGGTSKAKGGTGLGLPISRDIILAHNGKIWAESKLGEGSIFHFTLPIKK